MTSAKLFGASMAIGAFLAGMVVGRSDFSQRAASEALPMRDAFAVLFFVSVGMLFDPRHLAEAPALVAATLAVVLIGKPLAALIIVWLSTLPAAHRSCGCSCSRSDRRVFVHPRDCSKRFGIVTRPGAQCVGCNVDPFDLG